MPKLLPIQTSFSNGEVTPLLQFRSDDEGYKSSVEIMHNFISTAHGPARRRPGTEMIWWDEFGHAGDYGRIFPFYISNIESYVVLVTKTKIVVLDKTGELNLGNVIKNPYFLEGHGYADWSTYRVSVFDAVMRLHNLSSSSTVLSRLWQQVTVVNTNNEQILKIDQSIFTEKDHLPTDLNGYFYITATDAIPDWNDPTTYIQKFPIYGTTQEVKVTPGVGTFYIQFQAPLDDNYFWMIDSVTLSDSVTGVPIEFVSPYTTEESIDELKIDSPPNSADLYFVTRNVAPHTLTRTLSNNIWTFTELSYTTPPWGTSFPGSLAFHQGRLWYAGSKDKPATIWASKSLDYLDFDVTHQAAADDSLEFIMDTNGGITWLKSFKYLHVGTDLNENIVLSEGGVVAHDDARAERQSSYGSARIQPAYFADGFLFVDANRRRVYYSNFFDERNTYISRDITFKAEHITKGRIKEIEVAQTETITAWMADYEGKLFGNTTEITAKIDGWHCHNTQGKYKSLTTIEQKGNVEFYALVERSVGGTNRLMVERFKDGVYMDSATGPNEPGEHYMHMGFDHLEGQTVQILVLDEKGDYLLPDQVVSGASLTFDKPIGNFIAGLKYTSQLKTLPVEMMLQSGPTNVRMKRYNKLHVRLLDSARPIINGHNPRQRTPSIPMGTREINETSDIQITDLGTKRTIQVDIVQDLPFACTVIGIYGELTGENL